MGQKARKKGRNNERNKKIFGEIGTKYRNKVMKKTATEIGKTLYRERNTIRRNVGPKSSIDIEKMIGIQLRNKVRNKNLNEDRN